MYSIHYGFLYNRFYIRVINKLYYKLILIYNKNIHSYVNVIFNNQFLKRVNHQIHCVMCRVLEGIISKQLIFYFKSNNLLTKYQYVL